MSDLLTVYTIKAICDCTEGIFTVSAIRYSEALTVVQTKILSEFDYAVFKGEILELSLIAEKEKAQPAGYFQYRSININETTELQ